MKVAYLLLVHNQPEQTARLVKTLSNNQSHIFIHVDAKSDEGLFRNVLSDFKSGVSFTKERSRCIWGHYSLVEATLLLLKDALSFAEGAFDHFVLLSGQDYPIKPVSFIHQFLERYKGHDFIEYFALPSERLREKQGGLYRINRYHRIREKYHSEFPPYSKKPIIRQLLNVWANLHHQWIRKMPFRMNPYAGSQWWMLSRETAEEIISFLATNQQVEAFFRNVWIPDELFFQTIMLHLKKENNRLINNNYRLTVWEEVEKVHFIKSPKVLTCNDLPLIKNSEALFARKFDQKASESLIQQLDAMNT